MSSFEAKNFQELYLHKCSLTGETPDRLSIYAELDNLISYINKHAEKDNFLHAISNDRVCMVIPYSLSPEKRLPPDNFIKGEPVFYSCIGYDKYLSLIIDQMHDTNGIDFCGSIEMLNKWKILRLTKIYALGWQKFCEGYLR